MVTRRRHHPRTHPSCTGRPGASAAPGQFGGVLSKCVQRNSPAPVTAVPTCITYSCAVIRSQHGRVFGIHDPLRHWAWLRPSRRESLEACADGGPEARWAQPPCRELRVSILETLLPAHFPVSETSRRRSHAGNRCTKRPLRGKPLHTPREWEAAHLTFQRCCGPLPGGQCLWSTAAPSHAALRPFRRFAVNRPRRLESTAISPSSDIVSITLSISSSVSSLGCFKADRHQQHREIARGAGPERSVPQDLQQWRFERLEKAWSDASGPAVRVPGGLPIPPTALAEERNQPLRDPVRINGKQVVQPRRQHDSAEVSVRICSDFIEVGPDGWAAGRHQL